MLLLVRHALAGDRDDWEGDDRLRPLEPRGREQARALVALLEPRRPRRVLTSPALRCIETVAPLAAALGVEAELCDELGEDQQATAGARLVRALAAEGDEVVVSGHGGLERALLADPPRWRKGATLVLDPELAVVEVLGPPVSA